MSTILEMLSSYWTCLRFIDYRFVDLQFVIVFALQTVQRGVLGAEPPVLAFSLRVWDLVSREYGVLVFSE